MNIRIIGWSPAAHEEKYLGIVVVEITDILVSGLVLHDREQGLYLGRLAFDAEDAVRRQILLQLLDHHPEIPAAVPEGRS